eukprot:scaffold3324_cov371-Prasinococcus_capsulatus_cf.AAC.1
MSRAPAAHGEKAVKRGESAAGDEQHARGGGDPGGVLAQFQRLLDGACARGHRQQGAHVAAGVGQQQPAPQQRVLRRRHEAQQRRQHRRAAWRRCEGKGQACLRTSQQRVAQRAGESAPAGRAVTALGSPLVASRASKPPCMPGPGFRFEQLAGSTRPENRPASCAFGSCRSAGCAYQEGREGQGQHLQQIEAHGDREQGDGEREPRAHLAINLTQQRRRHPKARQRARQAQRKRCRVPQHLAPRPARTSPLGARALQQWYLASAHRQYRLVS